MTQMKIEIDSEKVMRTVREVIAAEWARKANDMNLALPVVLDIFERNSFVRCIVAEAIAVALEQDEDATYDDAAKVAIAELRDTRLGRCEA